MRKLDLISVSPNLETGHDGKSFVRAWKLDEAGRRLKAGDTTPHAIVATWIIEAPWAHPLWHSYILSLVHLREVEGQPPATIYRPDATHEMVLEALNPEFPRQAIFDRCEIARLSPVNFAVQLAVRDDAAAAAVALDVVQRIAKGRLNPDTDFRQQWVDLFGGNMLR